MTPQILSSRMRRRLISGLLGVLVASGSLIATVGLTPASATNSTGSSIYSWGYNEYGQLGDGTTNNQVTPEAISLAPGVTPTAIAAVGFLYSLAIGSNGDLYAWGDNNVGQLGDGTGVEKNSPEMITLAPDVTPTALAAGYEHSLAIGSDGNLYGWGDNFEGDLGDNSGVAHLSPVLITLAPGVSPTAIAAGGDDSFAIGSNGALYAWGYNSYGDLGDGSTTERYSPEVITLAPGVSPVAIAAGQNNDTFAIGSNGALYAWGFNSFGDLGDGSTTERYSPEVITLAPGVSPVAIAAGQSNDTFAIGSNGALYAWGANDGGSLGDGTAIEHNSPEVITLAPGVSVATVAAGNNHCLAIGSDGNLYVWGVNNSGGLGDGTNTDRPSPELITLAPGVAPTVVAAGYADSLAIGSTSLAGTPVVSYLSPVLGPE